MIVKLRHDFTLSLRFFHVNMQVKCIIIALIPYIICARLLVQIWGHGECGFKVKFMCVTVMCVCNCTILIPSQITAVCLLFWVWIYIWLGEWCGENGLLLLVGRDFHKFQIVHINSRANKIHQCVHGATNFYASISVWTGLHHVWHKTLHVHDTSIQSSFIICTCDSVRVAISSETPSFSLIHTWKHRHGCTHTCLTPTLPLHLTDFTYIQIEFSSLCPTNVLTNAHILPSL